MIRIDNLPMKIVAVTQARTTSTRLPRKVLMEIGGKTILEIHLRRLQTSKLVDKLIVATTVNEQDEAIAEIAKSLNIPVSRGKELDVLDRYYQAVKAENADYIVRITSDCPLVDGKIVDETVRFTIDNKLDYCSNRMKYTYPDGIVVEVFKFDALEKAWREAKLSSEREHVAPYIWKNSTYYGKTLFSSGNFCGIETDYAGVRITIDEATDFELLKILIEKFGFDKDWQIYADEVLNNPHLQQINGYIEKNEGYAKSLVEDKLKQR